MTHWTSLPPPDPDTLLCVVGPTASQKTELAIRLCERWGGEIVSADSVQVYRYFDVGTGKPTQQENARAVHHMVDIVEPTEPLNAADYATKAEDAIDRIRAKGKIPIVCGGSFLWVRAIVWGLADAPPANEAVRDRLRQAAQLHGPEALHARLAQVDPEMAAKLGPRDLVRIERALEVFEITGRKLSVLHREHQERGPKTKATFVGVRWSSETLEDRIRQRAQTWLEEGWIDEVRSLQQRGFGATRPMNSVGYKQVFRYLQDKTDESILLDEITRATKIFARRQRTWLRDEPVTWLDPLDQETHD